jgi:hypothetical protein
VLSGWAVRERHPGLPPRGYWLFRPGQPMSTEAVQEPVPEQPAEVSETSSAFINVEPEVLSEEAHLAELKERLAASKVRQGVTS